MRGGSSSLRRVISSFKVNGEWGWVNGLTE
jgi:hypothetical protein